jgi:hypothetical protein
MKKLNATKAIAVLSLGLMFSVVVAGCGGGNDTNELKVKNGISKIGNSGKKKSG